MKHSLGSSQELVSELTKELAILRRQRNCHFFCLATLDDILDVSASEFASAGCRMHPLGSPVPTFKERTWDFKGATHHWVSIYRAQIIDIS